VPVHGSNQDTPSYGYKVDPGNDVAIGENGKVHVYILYKQNLRGELRRPEPSHLVLEGKTSTDQPQCLLFEGCGASNLEST